MRPARDLSRFGLHLTGLDGGSPAVQARRNGIFRTMVPVAGRLPALPVDNGGDRC
ncbi:MAG TPA: hypothetical protein VGI96_31835 [Streptosporangiaceae bacterium]|jgi:hypothetical protein